jgi:hypothetical protein
METRFILAGVLVLAAVAWIVVFVPKMRRMHREQSERLHRLSTEFGTIQAQRLIRGLVQAESDVDRTAFLVMMRNQYIDKEHSSELQDQVWLETINEYLARVAERSPEIGPKLRDFVRLGVAP